jgi:DNA-binding protein Fis
MPDVQDSWCAYARLQASLFSRSRLNDQYWGIEAGLDHLLHDDALGLDDAAKSDRLQQIISSGRTKEQHRRGLRTRLWQADEESLDPLQTLDHRETIRLVLDAADPTDRAIVDATAMGHTSASIGKCLGIQATTVRKRLDRLRQRAKFDGHGSHLSNGN